MSIIAWKEAYRIGEEVIDRQHQYLFDLANAVVASTDKSELTGNAMNLFRYVREHFDHEEALMRHIGYPGYREHVAMHDQLISQLSAISGDIAKDQQSRADLRQFMGQWLSAHIVAEDTKLSGFLRIKP